MGKSRRGALSDLDAFKKQIQDNAKFAGPPAAAVQDLSEAPDVTATDTEHQPAGETRTIALDQIVVRPGFNVRSEVAQDDDFERLVQSLVDVGLMQPILVVPNGLGQYAVVAGHRRLAAAKVLGWVNIMATVKAWDHDTQTRANYMENRQRTNVNPFDDAKRAVEIMDSKGWSLRHTADYLGDSLGRLSGLVRMYRNPVLRLALEHGTIPLRWLNRLVALLDTEGQEKLPGSVECYLQWIVKTKPEESRFLESLENTKARGILPGGTTRPSAAVPAFDRIWTSADSLGHLADQYQATLSSDELMRIAHRLIAQGEQLAAEAQRRTTTS